MENTVSEIVASHTQREILQQPVSWMNTTRIIKERREDITSFLSSFQSGNVDVVLTGAGSSAFIGDAIQGELLKSRGIIARAVATTDLLTHPEQFLSKERKVLLVSFARSGDSPESMAAVHIVNKYCSDPYHMIITCNPEGRLYREVEENRTLKVLLPAETNDESLAMTSSFTSMMLAYIKSKHGGALQLNSKSFDVGALEVPPIEPLTEHSVKATKQLTH